MKELNGDLTPSHKYTDQELDNESGLYNYDARMYDPVIGRFISADPYLSPQLGNESNSRFRLSSDEFIRRYSDPQPLNRYSYARNNPLKYTDPSGLAEAKVIILITAYTIPGDRQQWEFYFGNDPNVKIYANVDSIQRAGEILKTGDIVAEEVIISGHGASAGGAISSLSPLTYPGQFNAKGYANPDNAEGVKNMKSGMDKNTILTYYSCKAGENTDDLQKTANIFNITVRGWTDYVYAGPNPTGNLVEKKPENVEEKKKMENGLSQAGAGMPVILPGGRIIPPMP